MNIETNKNIISTKCSSIISTLSTDSSKKNSLHDSTKKNKKDIYCVSLRNSYSKKIKDICIYRPLFYYLKNENKNNNLNINKHYKCNSTPKQEKDYINKIIIKILKKYNEMELEIKNKKMPYFKNIYSNEYIKFENEITKKFHFVKKYKEDDITFTKNKILPEMKWQDFDNDVLTSDEQKKRAIRREMNWLGETIKRIQNNIEFFHVNVNMYKLSQKYPNKI